MPYIPHTDADREEMLKTIGVSCLDDLFKDIPEKLKLKQELNIPSSLDEHQLRKYFTKLAQRNVGSSQLDWYLGAGIYDRYIPSIVPAMIGRGEFLTAYTPYQPELSQGYLQSIYEFQTMVSNLFAMEAANASMYDGSTAMAEAAMIACTLTQRKKVILSKAVHPHYRKVLSTYCTARAIECIEINIPEGATKDLKKLNDQAACLILQSPNFLGIIEDLKSGREVCNQVGAQLIVVSDPIAMGMLKPPGEYGADIVVAEGQQLGVPMGYGGPLLGLFACKKEYIRYIPGRIVGRTQDKKGQEGYVMTLRTREQDIRREKASSNICTNQALMALAATIYLTAVGKTGLREIAKSTARNAQYMISSLEHGGIHRRFIGRVFGEFVIDLRVDAEVCLHRFLEHGIMAGLPLGKFYPELATCMLVATTELRTKKQMDYYVEIARKVIQ